jgi:hypothetical protein
MKRFLLAAACVMGGTVVLVAATIDAIDLKSGYDDANRIVTPVYDTAGAAPVEIGTINAAYNRKAKFVRRVGGGFVPAARGPEYDLNPKVDIGVLLTGALRSESSAMGFRPAAPGAEAWRISGTLKDVYLESRQIYMGATLFYGYMDVELEVSSPAGEKQTRRLRLHNYFGGVNAGFGRKDEAQDGVAHLIVEGAQEIVARLNRDLFKAPPHPDMMKKLEGLRAGIAGKYGDLHHVALSGLGAAVPVLLEAVARDRDENVRSALIEALGQLQSPDAVAALAGRYAKEDEDCRWYTLKAMDYIGGPEAMKVVADMGTKDRDNHPKRLAARIMGTPAR